MLIKNGVKASYKTIYSISLILILIFNSCNEMRLKNQKDIKIKMRDTVELSTDIYFPVGTQNNLPVILIRTAYDKSSLSNYGEYYSKKGYVVAIQDVRGKYKSQGDFIPYINEGNDGYDTIEWLAKQEWSNGKVGMIGGSYSGSVQLAAAIERPSHLVTIIPNITPATPFYNTPFENGVFALGWAIRWSDMLQKDISAKDLKDKFVDVFKKDWHEELDYLPVIDLDKKVAGKEIEFWRRWLQENLNSDFFQSQNYFDKLDNIKIPVLLQSGWFDVANRGLKLLYQGLINSGNNNVSMIIGPWIHSDKSSNKIGDIDFGPEAGIDLFEIYTKWFDYWLKGNMNNISNMPKVQLFNIGPNQWEYSNSYPSEDSKETKFFLSKKISKDDSLKHERLVIEESKRSSGMKKYFYDPSNPNISLLYMMKKNKINEYQNINENRKDVLIFDTEAFENSFTITGPIKAVIYASSDAVDTDFSVTLTGIDLDGNIFPIGNTFGIIRAKYRNSPYIPELIERNKIYKYEIDLSHTYYTLKPGEKLRLEISSSSFPEYARNLNTGKNNYTTNEYKIAEQMIYFNKKYPSHLVLFTSKN